MSDFLNSHIKKIVLENWNASTGLGADVRAIEEKWLDDPKTLEIWSTGSENQIKLKNNLKLCMEAYDFKKSKAAIFESVGRSGQAHLVYAAIAHRSSHASSKGKGAVAPQLMVQVPRYMLSVYLNVLSGCDILTPHSHSRKPKCKLCGFHRADWPHLLFRCTSYPNRSKYFQKIIRALLLAEKDATQLEISRLVATRKLCCQLWNSKRLMDLFRIIMGADLERVNLQYVIVINTLVSAITPILYHVQSEWSRA